MRPKLLEVLACPSCSGDLQLIADAEGAGRVVSGRLVCGGCERTFEIRDGVPRFLLGDEIERARVGFDAQWRLRFAGKFESRSMLYFQDLPKLIDFWLSCLGPMSPGDWMLDAGCGTGEKAMEVAQRHPEIELVAMDIVDSVSISAERGASLDNLHFIQADVMHPPFKPGAFEKLVSSGVLNITASTESAFRTIARCLAPGGRILVWLYPDASDDKLFGGYYRIQKHFLGLAHRLPPTLLLWLIRLYVLVMGPVFYYRYKREIEPRLGQLDYYVPIDGVSALERYRSTVFVVFDTLVAQFSTEPSSEILGWYRDTGLTDVETDDLGHYWAQRPHSA